MRPISDKHHPNIFHFPVSYNWLSFINYGDDNQQLTMDDFDYCSDGTSPELIKI